jgi:hypothetical protein
VVGYVRVKDFKAKWLEYGTRPHQIKPKNRKALASAGKVVERRTTQARGPTRSFARRSTRARVALIAAWPST